MIYVVNKIKEENNSKNIVYTGFQNSGVKLLIKLLNLYNISYKIISGNINSKAKEDAKKYYNYYKYNINDITDTNDKKYVNDEYRVLIITKAGTEGVDTIATNNIYLIDPTWNEAMSEQIIARAIRYKSHHTLPKEKRHVNVYRLLLVKESDREIIEKIKSPKFCDYEIICKQFKEDRKQLNKINNEKKTGKVKIKDALSIMDINEKVEYKLLKSKEDRENYIKNLEFSRYKEKNNMLDIFSSKIPSIDLYIFILSKSKQKVINEMITKFDTFQSFEINEYEISLVNKLYNLYSKIKNKKVVVSDEEYIFDINKLRDNILATQDKNLNKFINSTRFNDLQNKITDNNIKKSLKGKIKQYNQFFTNHDVVDKLIKFSNIMKDKNVDELKILEPSAGFGNIVEGLIKTNILMKVDMVEIDEENRVVLEQLVSRAPDILELQKTKDFLKYLPSKKYDYIFMNPPFYLKKNKYLLKDIYDIDFVKRAYGMLKIWGVLIAITSIKYLNDEWYKEQTYFFETMKVKWDGIIMNELSKISNIEVAFIRIVKSNDSEDDELLKILDILNDNLISHGKEIEENTSDLIKEIDTTPNYDEILN